MQLLIERQIPWYESKLCTPERIPQIKEEVEKYFFPDGKKEPYWISFDIDGVEFLRGDLAEVRDLGSAKELAPT